MNSEKEKTSFFGFGQLRFVIGVILLLTAGLKAYQLLTVPLPLPVQNSVFTPLLEFLNNRYLLMFVVEGEILFALFLFSGIVPEQPVNGWMAIGVNELYSHNGKYVEYRNIQPAKKIGKSVYIFHIEPVNKFPSSE
ncbi:MAG: hypothetical protein LBL62_01970 [Planctomycetaceae bacterium]|nr:hypothetical protein [Planctomycetaceae bacterium]